MSPTTAAHVHADLGADVDVILDGGPARVGVESTVVDCTEDEPLVLRQGALTPGDLEAILGHAVELRTDGSRAAPGTLDAHYAPDAQIVLVTSDDVGPRAAELVARGQRVGVLTQQPDVRVPHEVEVLDVPADINDFARQLYALLRNADRRGLDVLLVVPPPPIGLGAAVTDRLTRAAARPGREPHR